MSEPEKAVYTRDVLVGDETPRDRRVTAHVYAFDDGRAWLRVESLDGLLQVLVHGSAESMRELGRALIEASHASEPGLWVGPMDRVATVLIERNP